MDDVKSDPPGFVDHSTLCKMLNNMAYGIDSGVHELTHRHHIDSGYRPTNQWTKEPLVPSCLTKAVSEWEDPGHTCTPVSGYPADPACRTPPRGIVWQTFKPYMKEVTAADYFDDKYVQRPDTLPAGMACSKGSCDLNSLLTETEAYMHGHGASLAFSNAGGRWSPGPEQCGRENIEYPMWNPVNVATALNPMFWAYTELMYMNIIRRHYPAQWANFLGQGAEDWTSVTELLVTHVDRAMWFAKVMLDRSPAPQGKLLGAQNANDIGAQLRQDAHRVAQDGGLLCELRKAIDGCGAKAAACAQSLDGLFGR